MLHLSLRDKLNHFCWTWVGIVVNGELEYNYNSVEIRKDWKEARCNGLSNVEVDLLRMIEGEGQR
jgi:hypothetical protein